MATGSRTLKLSILADVNQLNKSLKAANGDVEHSANKMGDFGKKAALAFAAAGIAAAAFLVKFAKDAIVAGEAAATANARIDQINKSMNLFGDSTAEVTNRLVKYAEQTARATGIDTNAIKATQAKLLTFKELALSADQLGGQFDRATQAALDLASAGFGAAETNAVQLGKALNDPIKGLTSLAKSGVTFTAQEKERIKVLVESNKMGEAQAQILKAIETQVGGTSLATANATEKMKVGFQQVTEKVGIALLPVLEKFVNFLLDKVFPTFERYVLPVVEKLTAAFSGNGGLSESVTNFTSTLTRIFLPIWNGLVSAFNSVKGAVKDNFSAFVELGTYIQKYLAPIIGSVLGAAFNIVGKIASGVITVVGSVVRVLNGLIGGAIDGINALIKAYNFANNIWGGKDIGLIGKPSTSTGFAVSGAPGAISGGGSSIPTIPTIPSISATGTTGASISTGTKATSVAAATIGTIAANAGGTMGVAGAGTTDSQNWARITNIAANAGAAAAVNTSTLAGIMAASGTTVNLTVNGAIDPESTARTIVNTLNDSTYRGTNGASNLVYL